MRLSLPCLPCCIVGLESQAYFFQSCADEEGKARLFGAAEEKNLALLSRNTMLKFGRQRKVFPYLDTIEITDIGKNAL